MIRNLKALGLALVAVFAFAAISASTASAETKIDAALVATPDETANITGTEVEGNHKFEIGGGFGTVECAETEFHSHITGKTTSVTVTPTYEKCTTTVLGTSRPTTITMNGCTYTFTVHEFNDVTGTGQVHLLCPENKKVEIHVFQSGDTTHTGATRCTYDVGPQTINGIHYENMAKGKLTPEQETVTIKADHVPVVTNKTSGTVLQCGGSEFNSEYTGIAETHAVNKDGKVIGLKLETDNTP